MAIPVISRADVLAALERIRKEGVPPDRQSARYSMVHDGRHYPPKYVVSLAVENATGRVLGSQEFGGGVETNSALRKLGFAVVAVTREAAAVVKGADAILPVACIGRVVVRGQTADPVVGETLLLDVLRNKWPEGTRLKFLITPGGFVVAPFPAKWHGGVSWNSRPVDLDALRVHAERVLSRTVTDRVLRAAEGKIKVLTVGIDLWDDDHSEHGELVAVCELATRRVSWTGKSYPTVDQERSLVQVVDLSTHLLPLANERVLVLGCHDLNMFSPRGWANQSPRGVRRRRCVDMRQLAQTFNPTIVLQHPHSTDTPNIWRNPWAELLRELPGVKSWASGIGYHRWGKRPRAPLHDVLSATQGGTPSIDFVVKPG